MPEWTEEKPTMELRFMRYKLWVGPAPFDFRIERRLQQKWEIVNGGTGKVEYIDEWRDVEVVEGAS